MGFDCFTIFFFSFHSLSYSDDKDVERSLKLVVISGCYTIQNPHDVSTSLFPPLTPSSSTSKQFFHSRKDIQTTMNVGASSPSAENAHHKCNYECSSFISVKFCSCLLPSAPLELSSSILQFPSSPKKGGRNKRLSLPPFLATKLTFLLAHLAKKQG
jgi:hypothetical protein